MVSIHFVPSHHCYIQLHYSTPKPLPAPLNYATWLPSCPHLQEKSKTKTNSYTVMIKFGFAVSYTDLMKLINRLCLGLLRNKNVTLGIMFVLQEKIM